MLNCCSRIICCFIAFLFSVQFGWSQITVNAIGNEIYCPLSPMPIVSSFTLNDTSGTPVTSLYIQISTGYVNGEDILTLSGSHPNITSNWSNQEGKLTLNSNGSATYTDFINAMKEVLFQSSNPSPKGERLFSITVGNANYLPLTNHYYKFVSDIGISWSDAKITAENSNYYGLQGYLATITGSEEAQICGEQSQGAGWIGGTDEETEGEWKWATGPEAGKTFWIGAANGTTNGTDLPFAFWNNGEPNNQNNEDYAHITDNSIGNPGSWNDLKVEGDPPGAFHPKGYIVEFGGMPGDPVIDIAAVTGLEMAEIISTNEAVSCGAGSVQLQGTATAGATVLWFDSANSLTPIYSGNSFTTPILSATTDYYVLASANGCVTGDKIPVTATIHPNPIIQTIVNFENCDEDGTSDGFTDFNLNEVTAIISNNASNEQITFYITFADASTKTNSINPIFNNSTANTVYARVENSDGCFLVSTINLQVSTTLLPSGFNFELKNCDNDTSNDGISSFDLTNASSVFLNQLPTNQNLSVHYFRNLLDAQLEQNEILNQTNYLNETPFTQKIVVRVENDDTGNCYGISEALILTVNPLPYFEVEESAILCLNLAPITLSVFNAEENYDYEWKDANGNILSKLPTVIAPTEGIYTVRAVSAEGCESFSKTIEVSASEMANISLSNLTIVEDSENNNITISTNIGKGNYEFSLNSAFEGFQEDPYFDYLSPGMYTLYVRDKNYCGIVKLNFSILGFPKFFTPNNDGYNDTWEIKGIDLNRYQISTLYIFNRFGKLIAEISPTKNSWDGFYKGERLPASDYWYLVNLTDSDGNVHEKSGHFSLIR